MNSNGAINATVADSVAANNDGGGFVVTTSSAPTALLVVRSAAANNGVGLAALLAANATLRVGQSTVTGNTTSWLAGSGTVLRSYGDNNIGGNGDGDPAPIIIAKK